MIRRYEGSKAYGRAIRNTKIYFLLFILWLVIAIFFLTTIEQGEEILYFIRYRGSIWDSFFKYATRLVEIPALIAMTVLVALFNYRKALWLLVDLLAVLMTAGATKLWFKHDRPIIFFEKLKRASEILPVKGVDLLRGDTSFPSGHTMAAFGVFTLLALFSRKGAGVQILAFIAAMSVAISRMYLSQHFLKDVLTGSVLGVLVALGTFVLSEKMPSKPNRGFLGFIKKRYLNSHKKRTQ